MVIDRREHDESHYELFYAPKPRKDHEYIHGDSVIAIEISALGLEIESQRQSSVHLVFAPMAAFSFLSGTGPKQNLFSGGRLDAIESENSPP